jgi:hypothetical protein
MILTKIGMCLQILVKLPNIKFYENPSIGSRLYAGTRTDIAKLKGPFLQLSVPTGQKLGTTK